MVKKVLDFQAFFREGKDNSETLQPTPHLQVDRQSRRPPPRSPQNIQTGCQRCQRATLKQHKTACQEERRGYRSVCAAKTPISLTLVFLGCVVVVDWFAVPLAFPQFAGQVLLLLLVVMSQQFLPVIRIHILLLFDDLTFNLLDLQEESIQIRYTQ